MASAFNALKPPSREDRIAAAKEDGSFDGKREAYNKSARVHGLRMDENGMIKRMTPQEESDEERWNHTADPKDKSFRKTMETYNKSDRARRLGLEMWKDGTVFRATSPSRSQLFHDMEKYEPGPRERAIEDKIDSAQRLSRKTQHLLNYERMRSSGKHKEAEIQKKLYDEIQIKEGN